MLHAPTVVRRPTTLKSSSACRFAAPPRTGAAGRACGFIAPLATTACSASLAGWDGGYCPSSRLCRIFPASTAVSMTPRMTDAVWPTSHSFPGNVGPAGLTRSRQLSRFSLHRVFR